MSLEELVDSTPKPAEPAFEEPLFPPMPSIINEERVDVEARYQLLEDRRRAAHRAAVSRSNAATARAVAQAFAEYARAFRKVASTKGSDVDHAVAVFLAATCEDQAEHYSEMQARCTAAADREGSL